MIELPPTRTNELGVNLGEANALFLTSRLAPGMATAVKSDGNWFHVRRAEWDEWHCEGFDD